jgi:hypothetical protein
LQVYPFPRCIRGYENAEGVTRWVGIKGIFNGFPAFFANTAMKYIDAFGVSP